MKETLCQLSFNSIEIHAHTFDWYWLGSDIPNPDFKMYFQASRTSHWLQEWSLSSATSNLQQTGTWPCFTHCIWTHTRISEETGQDPDQCWIVKTTLRPTYGQKLRWHWPDLCSQCRGQLCWWLGQSVDSHIRLAY